MAELRHSRPVPSHRCRHVQISKVSPGSPPDAATPAAAAHHLTTRRAPPDRAPARFQFCLRVRVTQRHRRRPKKATGDAVRPQCGVSKNDITKTLICENTLSVPHRSHLSRGRGSGNPITHPIASRARVSRAPRESRARRAAVSVTTTTTSSTRPSWRRRARCARAPCMCVDA